MDLTLRPLSWLLLGSALGLAGCGDSAPGAEPTNPGPQNPLDGLVIGEWQPLLEAGWTLAPGEEDYICARRTVTEDSWVDAFDTGAPSGTHHTVLTTGRSSGQDGVKRCRDPFEGHIQMLHATGVGTGPVEFPEGVATKLEAGTQLHLNIHIFNTSAETISGTTSTLVRGAAEEDIAHKAEAVLMGPDRIRAPAREVTTVRGVCTQSGDNTVFAMIPHMHQIGTHMTVVAESSIDGTVTIHDEAFDFEQQTLRVFPEVALARGDEVFVDCTYDNPHDETVRYGESSTDEMCYAMMFRYPPAPDIFGICSE